MKTDLNMSYDPNTEITNFIQNLKANVGYLPKWNHSAEFNGKIFYNAPYFSDEELIAGVSTFLLGNWGAAGLKVNQFESEFSKIVNNKESVMVNSGSSANLLAIAALKEHYKLQDGDEVICCSSCFPTTVSAIIHNNLFPLFIDAKLTTLNIDLDKIEAKITPKTKCFFLAPTLGCPPNIDRILEICKKHSLILAGDFCDSLLSTFKGKQLNEFVEISTCSFFVSHHICTAAHGGMISSNNPDLIKIARSFSRWGQSCFCNNYKASLSNCGQCGRRESAWFEQEPDLIWQHNYFYERVGYNCQPSMDMQGAIGLVQLKKLPEIHSKRQKNKELLESWLFKNIEGLTKMEVPEHVDVSWFGTPVICKDYTQKRKIINFLTANNIQYREMFTGNILLHGKYAEYGPNYKEFPVSNEIMRRVFFLGASPTWSEQHLNYIEKVLKNYEHP